MVFEKLFGWSRKKENDPPIFFGRYSDNNKSVEKVEKWTLADELFKQKEYTKSLEAFFDYLCDEDQDNVRIEKDGSEVRFFLYQGSKLIRGRYDQQMVRAETFLAKMPEPSVPVMRKLLEMNYHLYYTRYAIKEDMICMSFDTPLSAATPNRMYYGLKELATKSDKQDDLLISDFPSLEAVDTEHVQDLPDEEKTIKFTYLHKWIKDTLDYTDTLDAEKFSGGISYLFLTLVFRIDYLIAPEGKILSELEKIASIYYSKDDKSQPDRNPSMTEALKKLLSRSKKDICGQLFRSRYTFSIVPPHNLKVVTESIQSSLQNMTWYRDNNYPDIANAVMEYGFAYSQYSYSLPRPLSDLFRLFMQINHSEYFRALGFETSYYDNEKNDFQEDDIMVRIDTIVNYWKQKYPSFNFKTRKLKFDTLLNFNQSFLQEVSELNFE